MLNRATGWSKRDGRGWGSTRDHPGDRALSGHLGEGGYVFSVDSVDPVSPNPTSGRAVLRLTLAEAGPVAVEVYDALGRRGSRAALAGTPGVHAVDLGAERLSPGLYVARVVAPDSGQVAAEARAFTVVR